MAREALPILISIPSLAAPIRVTRVKPSRRRLRREIRLAGYALIALVPIASAFAAFAGIGRPSMASASTSEIPADQAASAGLRASVISIEPLEPVVAVSRDRETAVILPGYLLPADTSEESSDGGH